MKTELAALLVACIGLTGCSVGMASRTGGVKPDQVISCQSRNCFLALDTAQIVSAEKHEDGSLTETYKFQLKRGSAGRAAMHGVLDVATAGMWEVVGTPMEATKNKHYMVITANYRPDGTLKTATLGAAEPAATDSSEK